MFPNYQYNETRFIWPYDIVQFLRDHAVNDNKNDRLTIYMERFARNRTDPQLKSLTDQITRQIDTNLLLMSFSIQPPNFGIKINGKTRNKSLAKVLIGILYAYVTGKTILSEKLTTVGSDFGERIDFKTETNPRIRACKIGETARVKEFGIFMDDVYDDLMEDCPNAEYSYSNFGFAYTLNPPNINEHLKDHHQYNVLFQKIFGSR